MNRAFAAVFRVLVASMLVCGSSLCVAAVPQSEQFSYQGQLKQNGSPANGSWLSHADTQSSALGTRHVSRRSEVTQLVTPEGDKFGRSGLFLRPRRARGEPVPLPDAR